MYALDEQIRRACQKLDAMRRSFPTLIGLDPPVSQGWLASFEASCGVVLPLDYARIITQAADGGYMPSFLTQRYWRSFHILHSTHKNLRQTFPLTESFIQDDGAFDFQNLPGQWLLMGGADLGWSLILNGPFRGEVWTMGTFGAVRAPACSFSQIGRAHV